MLTKENFIYNTNPTIGRPRFVESRCQSKKETGKTLSCIPVKKKTSATTRIMEKTGRAKIVQMKIIIKQLIIAYCR